MLYIITALQCEAKPLIRELKLAQDHAESRWQLYTSDTVCLIVSGTGKIRSAMAVEYVISRLSKSSSDDHHVIANFGICGAVDTNTFEIGELVVVNKVRDSGSGRCYFPDMLLRHDCAEASVETVDIPVSEKGVVSEALVDMEASGFFEAASSFLPPDRIFCLKVVSDHLDISKLTAKFVSGLINDHLSEICRSLDRIRMIAQPERSPMADVDRDQLADLTNHLKFTVTQQEKLRKVAEAHIIRTGSDLSDLKIYFDREIKSKAQSKAVFKEIETVLNSDAFL